MNRLTGPAFRFLKRIGIKPSAQPIQTTSEPIVAKLVSLLRSKQYQRLDKVLSRLPEDQYSYVMYNMVRVEGVAKMLERWERRAEAEHVFVASGLAMIDQAWAIQGGYYARNVPSRVWEVFYAKLQEAEKILQKAQKLAPSNPEPQGIMLISGIGLELEKEEIAQRFEAVRQISPQHYRLHTNMLKSLKPKWNRGEEEMFSFARQVALNAPNGSGLHTLIVLAHFEVYSQLLRREEGMPSDYFLDAEVRDEILEAYHRSLGSPDHIQTIFADEQRNWFCAALHLCRARRETQHEITRMRNRYTTYPWCTMTKSLWEQHDHGWVVDRVRREVGVTPRDMMPVRKSAG